MSFQIESSKPVTVIFKSQNEWFLLHEVISKGGNDGVALWKIVWKFIGLESLFASFLGGRNVHEFCELAQKESRANSTMNMVHTWTWRSCWDYWTPNTFFGAFDVMHFFLEQQSLQVIFKLSLWVKAQYWKINNLKMWAREHQRIHVNQIKRESSGQRRTITHLTCWHKRLRVVVVGRLWPFSEVDSY